MLRIIIINLETTEACLNTLVGARWGGGGEYVSEGNVIAVVRLLQVSQAEYAAHNCHPNLIKLYIGDNFIG